MDILAADNRGNFLKTIDALSQLADGDVGNHPAKLQSIMFPMRSSCHLRRLLRYHMIRFFRIQGSNEKAARGFAVGLTCNFFPTFGWRGPFF